MEGAAIDIGMDTELLLKAMKLERYQHKFFILIAKMVKDEKSRELFLKMADEDRQHQMIIMGELGSRRRINIDFSASKYLKRDIRDILKNRHLACHRFAIHNKERIALFYDGAFVRAKENRAKDLFLRLTEREEAMMREITTDLSRLLKRECDDKRAKHGTPMSQTP